MAALAGTPSIRMSMDTVAPLGNERRRALTKGIRKSLPHRHTPSTSASIPSRYQTFFHATTESRGFNSQATRFQEHLNVNDNPGPGSYVARTGSLKTHSTSFSKKGTGGFASRTNRFSRQRRLSLGPGAYDPREVGSRKDFNRAPVSRGLGPRLTQSTSSFHLQEDLFLPASNFQKPIAVKAEHQKTASPAPNTYNLSGVHTGKNSVVTAEAAFKSRSRRDALPLPTAGNPSPGQYEIQDGLLHRSAPPICAVFKSRSRREGALGRVSKGPGPADYSPFPLSEHQRSSEPKQLPYYKQKHYLCISAPAMPLPPLPPSPGPGHYEIQSPPSPERRLASGAVFLSTTSRWGGASNSEGPGPGSYDPALPLRRSYMYNVQQKWV